MLKGHGISCSFVRRSWGSSDPAKVAADRRLRPKPQRFLTGPTPITDPHHDEASWRQSLFGPDITLKKDLGHTTDLKQRLQTDSGGFHLGYVRCSTHLSWRAGAAERRLHGWFVEPRHEGSRRVWERTRGKWEAWAGDGDDGGSWGSGWWGLVIR